MRVRHEDGKVQVRNRETGFLRIEHRQCRHTNTDGIERIKPF